MKKTISLMMILLILLTSCGTSSQEEVTSSSEVISLTETTETVATSDTRETEPDVTAESVSQTTETEPPAQTTETTVVTTTATTSETTATTEPTPPPDNSARDELFAHRIRTPRTVVATAGELTYTVTFDREEYYFGEDINLRIKVENTGTQSATFLKIPDASLRDVIRVDFCPYNGWDGERKLHYGLVSGVAATAPRIYHWEPGVSEEMTGRIPTYKEGNFSLTNLTILISIDLSHMIEIPMTTYTDVPVDYELLPYFQNGFISEGLYKRARVMNDEETIPVVVPHRGIWNYGEIQPGEEVPLNPAPDSRVGMVLGAGYVFLTRDQLLTMLAYHSAGHRTTDNPLKYFYESDVKDLVPGGYPVDGV